MAISVRDTFDLDIEAGATAWLAFTFRLPVPSTNPVQYQDANLVGWTALFQIRETPTTPGTAVISKSLPFNGTTALLELTAAQTALLVKSKYAYGLQLRHPSGEPVIRLIQKTLFTDPEVVHG